MAFEPPVIIPHSSTNTFSTVTQPFAMVNGVWRGVREPTIAHLLTEHGILPEVPLENNPASGDGSDKNVICRWLTPPYQTIGGENNPQYLDVGVIAFHYSGIRKVVFYLNGSSTPVEVSEVTYNPEIDASAYWVRIDSALLTTDSGDIISRTVNAGKPTSVEVLPHHELQAVVYPNNGKPRILVGKHENASSSGFIYNAIPRHIDPDRGIEVGSTQNTGIRSFYFSSNKNNTLFNKALYVDATSAGLDDITRDGSTSQPYKTIEFALKQLMTLKHRHYNPSSSVTITTDGDVGGGTIYLKDLGEGPEKYIGHKWGVVNWTGSRQYKTFSRMRWVTVAKDPIVGNRIRAKIKGGHPQTDIALSKQNIKQGIATQLLKIDNCYFEIDWPYCEYIQGLGPVLDYSGINQGIAPDAKLQHNYNDWVVKRGVGNQTGSVDASDQAYPLFDHSEASSTVYKYSTVSVENSDEVKKVGIVPLYQWMNNCFFDGGERNRHRIYEWAEANGMTYTTTMVPVPDFRSNLPSQFPEDKKGVFRKDGFTPAPLGLSLASVPAIFVQAQVDAKGFTTALGYTFEFPWSDPEGSSPRATLENALGFAFVTNSVMKSIEEPAQFFTDIWLNSTLDQWEADVFKVGGVIYQMFAINGYRTHNYVNKDGATFFRIHSDMFQTSNGLKSFKYDVVGTNNLIFYRYNNPSPRSKRYYDLTARHGVVGEGPLTNVSFEGQWTISGRHVGQLVDKLHRFTVEEGGDGKTYEFFAMRNVKDLAFVDCLLKTPDGTQQTVFTCPQENLLYYNTMIVAASREQDRTIPDINFTSTTTMGGSVYRYKDAVPSTPRLTWPMDTNDLNQKEAVSYDLAVFDNLQCYVMKEEPIDSPTHPHFNTYDEQLIIWVGNGSTDPEKLAKVNIDCRGRPDGYRNPLQTDPRILASDLSYPFERTGGMIGPNQKVGNSANISFPVMKTDKLHAASVGAGTIDGQPNSSTRGTWYENTLQGDIVGANYGWTPSAITYENFVTTHNPEDGSTLSKTNATILQFDPGNTFLNKESLGFANDPSNPNQRGFRNKILYRFTNFDYDGTRGEFGQIRPRSEFVDGTEIEPQTGTPPTPISNHPITVRLSTTDITKEMSWSRKDHLDNSAGTTHGPDGIYSSSDLIQIPNFLERIEEVTDPNGSPEIGPSVNTEIIGNTFAVGNQGGVYVTGGVADFTLDTTTGKMNSIDITNISTVYLNKARKNNGLTMSLILHGKNVSGTSMAEFKYIAAEPQQFDSDGNPIPTEGDIDLFGEPYLDFYKKFAYIAFNSRESQVTQSITSNQFSFRKSPHHTFVQFNRAEIEGLSLSNALNGTSIMDMVTPIAASKLAKLQTAAIGCTCTFNSNTATNESTSANRINPSSSTTLPSIITCKSVSMEYLGSEANGNQIRFKNKSATSMFSGRVGSTTYQHNGAIGAFDDSFQFSFSTNDYRIPAPPPPVPGEPPAPEPTINLRFANPAGSGSKNLLAYKVANGIRLFGGTNNIGITAGSYIRISGSPNNNGIYQVKNVFDGIDGDTPSNTAVGGLPEFQYLELSRGITPQEQSNPTTIIVENVSHLPILHIKYKQQV